MVQGEALQTLQRTVWDARLPLEIRLAASECRTFNISDPYLTAYPRLSYLPLLLPRLHKFFSPALIADPETVSPYQGYFTFDDVPLKWHLPLGLLYDVYVLSTQDAGPESSGAAPLPFQLTLHFNQAAAAPSAASSSEKPSNSNSNSNNNHNPSLPDATPVVLHDSFINSVKEADFLRSGTAKPIMTLSAQESKALWKSTQDNDLPTFSKIHNSLVPASGQIRNIPLRVYLPSSPDHDPGKAQIKVIQSHVPPSISSSAATSQTTPAALRTPSGGQPQTLGNALHQVLPSIFPSRRTTMLGTPLLHGAPVPMNAHLEELYRSACYADGWLSIVVAMRG